MPCCWGLACWGGPRPPPPLFLTGGPHNPFSAFYLIHIAMAASLLGARWTWSLLALALICSLALTACGPEVQGSPKPPPAFGPVQSSWFGCPSMQGVYAWPPVEPAGVRGSLPFFTGSAEMQVWVQQQRGETTLRTRTINRARNVRTSLTRQWSLVTYSGAQARCSSGMLDLAPQTVSPDKEPGASGVLQGFRLALLKDGGLAVGKRTVSTGNKGSYFSWGGQSYGSYDAPDVETWTWFKLARTAAGDSDPPVIDAYTPGATSP